MRRGIVTKDKNARKSLISATEPAEFRDTATRFSIRSKGSALAHNVDQNYKDTYNPNDNEDLPMIRTSPDFSGQMRVAGSSIDSKNEETQS